MGREGGAQETELAPATGTGPWLTKVRKTIDGTQPSCPLQGIAQKVFDLGARHRVVRQCRDMHATLCRLAILTRVTQDISVGVARARFELPTLCQPPDPALGRPHRHATRLGELGGARGPVSLDDRRDEVANLVAARPGHEPRHRHARAEHIAILESGYTPAVEDARTCRDCACHCQAPLRARYARRR